MTVGNLKCAFSQGLFEASSTQKEELGTLRVLQDGRKFRYVKADGTGLGAGKACVAPTATANHINRAVAAAHAVGATSVAVPVGATEVTADQYVGGFLQVNDATGEGYQYKIIGNTACASGGTTTVQLEDPLQVALTATSEVSLIPSSFSGVGHTTTEESVAVGGAVRAISANYYGWVQSGGEGIALIDGTPAVGSMLIVSDTSGALEAMNSTLDVDQPYIALMRATAGVDTEYKPVTWKID